MVDPLCKYQPCVRAIIKDWALDQCEQRHTVATHDPECVYSVNTYVWVGDWD